MGLDMFLTRTKRSNEEFKNKDVPVVEESWRKANAIHGWFVRNVQDGVDDCGRYEVSRKQIEKLDILCEEVLKRRNTDTSEKLLPHMQGFFFGAYNYDEWYYDYVSQTRGIIRAILTNYNSQEDIIQYESWW